ncbi:MAG: MATE family efflux transporter, partial [Clostridia bacterium]|nr:MATE family efflux transporter [Clostridia bacterium]
NKSLLRLTKTKFYARALLKSCANGSAEFLSNVSAAVITMLYNFQVDKFEGDLGVAAYGAIAYVTMIFYSLFMGYTVGSAPLIAYNFGSKNKVELKNLFNKSLIIITVTGLLMTALSQALGYPFVKMFGYSDDLFKITLRGFRIYSCVFIIVGFNMFGSSLFTALNNGLISAVISSMRIAFCITAVLVFPLAWGIDGVWAASNFAELFAIATTVLFVLLYRKKYGY